MRSDKVSPKALWKAFDEAAFGSKNTLNLRDNRPTAADARYRAESWLRERQISKAQEVLVITGRGNSSPGGVSVVREAVAGLLPELRRRGVVANWKEHGPGSFVVTLAPVKSLLEAPRRKRDRTSGPPIANPESLSALENRTLELLRRLAVTSLEGLGVRATEPFVAEEMESHFNKLAVGIPSGADGEELLRRAILSALEQIDE